MSGVRLLLNVVCVFLHLHLCTAVFHFHQASRQDDGSWVLAKDIHYLLSWVVDMDEFEKGRSGIPHELLRLLDRRD